jgi:hypothetical protein
MVAAGYAVAFILLTSNISSMYNGIDNDVFAVTLSPYLYTSCHLTIIQAHVEAIGPATFTLINSLPIITVQGLLCFEIVNTSGSAVLGLSLVVLVLSPGLLQIAGNALLLYQELDLNPEDNDHA